MNVAFCQTVYQEDRASFARNNIYVMVDVRTPCQSDFALSVAGRYQKRHRFGLDTTDCLRARSADPEMGWHPPARFHWIAIAVNAVRMRF